MTERPRRLQREIGVTTVGMTVTKLLAASGGVIVARLLGPADKGLHAVVVVIVAVVALVGTGGLEYWLAREVASRGSRVTVVGVVRRHVTGASAVAGACAAVALVGHGMGMTSLVPLAGVAFAWATVVSMLHLALLGGERRMRTVAYVTVASGAAYVGALALLWASGARSVTAVLACSALSTTLLALLTGAAARGTVPDPEARRLHVEGLRFGMVAAVSELVTYTCSRVDFVLLALLAPTATLGQYSVAVALTEVLLIVPNSVTQVLLPHVAGHPERRDTALLLRVSTCAVALGGLVVVLAGPWLISSLFGAPFRAGADALPALVAGTVLFSAWKLLSADVVARGRPQARIWSACAGLVSSALACVVLVPAHGMVGAAVSSTLGYAVAAVAAALSWTGRGGGAIRDLWPVRRSDVSVLRRGPDRRRSRERLAPAPMVSA